LELAKGCVLSGGSFLMNAPFPKISSW